MNINTLTKANKYCLFVLLIAVSSFVRAELICDFNSSRSDTTGLDFSKVPNEVPTSMPIGSVIYTNNLPISIWCAKKIGNDIAKGPEDVYINTYNISNILGSQSGLTVFVTVNGDRNYTNRRIKTGLSTEVPYLGTSINTDNYLQFEASIIVEVVKTGENVSLNPTRNDVALFSIGSEGSGSQIFYLRNTKKLVFTTQTCEVFNGGNYRIMLPAISSSNITGVGSIPNHNTDFEVGLTCNSNLWSNMGIHMSLSGANIAGLEKEGVFSFKNKETGEVSTQIAVQIFHKQGNTWSPVEVNSKFKVSEFGLGLSTIWVPLRAAYYALQKEQTAGEYQSILVYTISYE
ncbi:fimbrial protein [Erwinia sp. 9145]|uniref:fimbrial protein n=1 Tax=Erwinia sp. 9145 TaxID=1500895 RepID=UPI0009E543F7|nr:fimbrial protein [Erwinia sp. 9145]